MGTFKSVKMISGSPAFIPQAGLDVANYFKNLGYEVHSDSLVSGGYDISVSKGNIFKAVLGMKTALKIVIRPQGEQFSIEAGVGIFGQQAIPTLISMLFFWPVLATQIWGLVEQSRLDEKAIEIAETSIQRQVHESERTGAGNDTGQVYCTKCGTPNAKGVKFCCECGSKQ